MLLVEIRVFHRTAREAFQGLQGKHPKVHGKLWCGMIYFGGNLTLGFQCFIYFCLTIEKLQPCPQEG